MMESVMIILAGILVMIGTYLLLSKNMLRIILGTSLMSHAVHMLLMIMGGLKTGSVPLLGEKATIYTDALPQALILTAIVISFGVTAFFLVLAYRTFQETGTDNLDQLRGLRDE